MPQTKAQPKGFDQQYFADFLDQEQALIGFEQRYRQITRGRFAGMIARLDLGEMQIQRERTNCTMAQEFRFPEGLACYGFALGQTAAGHSDQGVMRTDRPHQPRAARDNWVYIEADCDLLVLTLPETQAAIGAPSPSESRAFANWLAGVMEDCTVTGLSAALGRERSALRGACLALTGQRLDALLGAQRLNAAHRALRYSLGGRVQEIGLQQGYTHFGRFSKAYAEMFGRLPSETLRAAPPALA